MLTEEIMVAKIAKVINLFTISESKIYMGGFMIKDDNSFQLMLGFPELCNLTKMSLIFSNFHKDLLIKNLAN